MAVSSDGIDALSSMDTSSVLSLVVCYIVPSCIVILSLTLLVFYWLPRRKLTASSPPMIGPSSVCPLPVLGPCIEFGKSPVKMVQRCFDEAGPVFTVPILHKRLTFLLGPEAQEPFFKYGDDILSQQEVYDFMKPVFGPGVVYDADRKKRQVQFQSMAHGLRASRLKSYVAKIERETEQFLRQDWGEEGTVDLLETLSELTILTASRCLHGNDVRENLFREVAKLYHDLDQGLTPLTVFLPNAPIQAHKKRNEARAKMVALFSKVIEARRANPALGGDGTDILTIFMNVKYKDGTPINNEEVTGLLIALLFAGQHTSCITSTWTTLFLIQNPTLVQRVLEEQREVLGANVVDGPAAGSSVLDYDKVNEMALLHNSMREALRLCPPLILLMRKVMKEFTVTANQGKSRYTIPKDDIVMVAPSVAMRIPSVFRDPETFDPDRYNPGREEHKIPYAYLGFGGGMHSCMGQNFGFVQVKTILSVLFRTYEMEMVADKLPECDYEAMVVGPKGDCRVRYKKRNV